MKKMLVAFVAGLAVALSANVATAYVAMVATAVPITAAVTQDRTQLDHALEAVIRDVLQHAIGFTPTVVTLERAAVVGDRLYIVLFIADRDGESIIETLTRVAPQSTPDDQDDSDAADHRDGVSIPRDTPSAIAPELAPSL